MQGVGGALWGLPEWRRGAAGAGAGECLAAEGWAVCVDRELLSTLHNNCAVWASKFPISAPAV